MATMGNALNPERAARQSRGATPLEFEQRMTHYVGSTGPDAWRRLTPRQRRRLDHKENHARAPFTTDGVIIITSRP